jgi:hypothetical protein
MKTVDPVVDLTAVVRDGVTINVAKDGTAAVTVAENLYASSLPEGIDLPTVEKLNKHNNNLYLAFATVVGEKGLDAMKKNTNCASIEATLPLVGKDTFVVSIDRQKEYPKPGSKDGEKITQFGVMNAQLNTVGASDKRGGMKKLRDQMKADYAAAFGS